MSVWTADSQRVDLLKRIYNLGEPLNKILLPERPSDYLGCEPRLIHPAARDDWDDLAQLARWGLDPDGPEDSDLIAAFFQDHRKVTLGLPAVYELVYMVAMKKIVAPSAYNRKVVDDTADMFMQLVAPSTQVTPAKFIERAQFRDQKMMGEAEIYEDAAEMFKRIRQPLLKSSKAAVDVQIEYQKTTFPYRFVCVGGLLVALGRNGYSQKALVLGKIHLDYLVGALSRLANTVEYYAGHKDDNLRGTALQVVRYTCEKARNAGAYWAGHAAKAFHKARGIYQMQVMNSILTAAVEGEIADYNSDRLEQLVPLDQYKAILAEVTQVQALELIHIYKWMPPPDFDATTAPLVVHDYHMNHRRSALDDGASDHEKDLYERIKVERKINLATAFYARHNQWPAGLTPRGKFVTPAEARAWDPVAIEAYSQMGKDITSQIKDKVVVAPTLERELHTRKQPHERSYLLWYMKNAGLVDTKVDLRDLAGTNEENFVRSAYKPEAHKPDSRLFYMATPRRRTLLGELEANLSNMARAYPGSLMGKDTADRARICSEIMDAYTPCQGVPLDIDVTTYIITFDLSKFSPKSSPAVTKEYHEFWANVYGSPEIANLYEIGCLSKITHNTAGIEFTYQNPGCDLEGFRGRMMTMFHADMLSAAARLGRERGCIAGRSKLATFIDDGALKVAVVGLGAVARANAIAFLECMREVYAAAGQDNHPSKTLVSPTGGEILATLYYRGLAVPQGVKAIMKLIPDYESNATTFPEDTDSLYATAQGAVKAGGDWVITYRMLVRAVVKNMIRWSRKTMYLVDPARLALQLMTPKSMGGFGVTSLQGLVTNAAVNATLEGIGMLNRAARMYPARQVEIMRIVTRPVVKRDPLSILRDPMRIRMLCPVMVENRMTVSAVRWLENNAAEYAGFMRAYKNVDLVAHATKVAEALLTSGVVSVPLLERAWAATPLHFVEGVVGKFKRSATILALLGFREVNRIRKRNMDDLVRILTEW